MQIIGALRDMAAINSQIDVPVALLGQSGCRLSFPDCIVFLDPYLSNSVQVLDAADLKRLTPIPIRPENVTDADWVLLTHEHIDHCDPHTIPQLAAASPQAHFVGPQPVIDILCRCGITEARLHCAQEHWQELSNGLELRALPAAHPEIVRDANGNLRCVGYLLDYNGQKIYLAGDTCVRQEIIEILICEGPIHTAFLPVNEHNFFRERRGIVGNMSVREAFQFAEEINARNVVPVHWDMFAINETLPDEMWAIYRRMNPSFNLLINPEILYED